MSSKITAEKQRQENLEGLRDVAARVYSKRGPVKNGTWRGHRVIKFPTDLLVYQDIIHSQRPELIIETGTRFGGGALFLADMCELNNYGHVVTIEIDDRYVADQPKHERITYMLGDSADPAIVDAIKGSTAERVLVILDGDHRPEQVKKELAAYSPLVHVGGYLVIEDCNDEGANVEIDAFLEASDGAWVRDEEAEKYGIHAARGGFLRRVR